MSSVLPRRSPLRSLPPPSPVHKKALALARIARGKKMTSESFVFGNLPAERDSLAAMLAAASCHHVTCP